MLRQVTLGALHAKRLGSFYVISRAEVERYRQTHLGKRGIASPDHPLHRTRRGDDRTRGGEGNG